MLLRQLEGDKNNLTIELKHIWRDGPEEIKKSLLRVWSLHDGLIVSLTFSAVERDPNRFLPPTAMT